MHRLSHPNQAQPAPWRAVAIGHPQVRVQVDQGVMHLQAVEPLQPYPARLLERLVHWAEVRPEQTFVARRDGSGQ